MCFLHNICSILGLNLLTFIVFLFSRSRSVIPWACNLQHVEMETAWKQKAQMQRKHIRSNAGKTENKKKQWRRKFPSVFVSAARPDIQKSVCLGISVRFSKQITFLATKFTNLNSQKFQVRLKGPGIQRAGWHFGWSMKTCKVQSVAAYHVYTVDISRGVSVFFCDFWWLSAIGWV